MKINFTKKEYRLLTEILAITDWVMHSRSIGDETIYHEHRALKNKLFSYYKDFEAKDLIEPGHEKDAYYEKNELLDKIVHEFMSKYDDEVFWDELISKLAMRDIIDSIGEHQFEQLEDIERMKKITEAEEFYIKEFEKHGLACVRIEDIKTNH